MKRKVVTGGKFSIEMPVTGTRSLLQKKVSFFVDIKIEFSRENSKTM